MNSQTLQPNASLQGGKYRIVRVLGQGGFGITYLAEHKVLDTKVAIKEFFMKELNNRDESTSQVSVGSEGSRELVMKFRDKFIKEARNIASLKHPNIIRIHDVFEENGTAYYVMEYCDGESLNELLKMHPAGLGEAMAVKYIRQVASALRYIHERKMNHLDVKPANIMINAGNAVLIDFGLSKQYDSTGSQTSTTPVGISHGFAPIEQYKQGGVSEFSPATDIYSLGATLYKLITGQTPPDAQTLIEEDLPSINATASVVNAIRQAMQVSRSNRPQSIAAWVLLLDSSAKSSIDDESTQVLTKKSSSKALYVVLCIVAVIIAIVYFSNSNSSKKEKSSIIQENKSYYDGTNICPKCNGQEKVICPRCNGTGEEEVVVPAADGSTVTLIDACSICEGSGKIICMECQAG